MFMSVHMPASTSLLSLHALMVPHHGCCHGRTSVALLAPFPSLSHTFALHFFLHRGDSDNDGEDYNFVRRRRI